MAPFPDVKSLLIFEVTVQSECLILRTSMQTVATRLFPLLYSSMNIAKITQSLQLTDAITDDSYSNVRLVSSTDAIHADSSSKIFCTLDSEQVFNQLLHRWVGVMWFLLELRAIATCLNGETTILWPCPIRLPSHIKWFLKPIYGLFHQDLNIKVIIKKSVYE